MVGSMKFDANLMKVFQSSIRVEILHCIRCRFQSVYKLAVSFQNPNKVSKMKFIVGFTTVLSLCHAASTNAPQRAYEEDKVVAGPVLKKRSVAVAVGVGLGVAAAGMLAVGVFSVLANQDSHPGAFNHAKGGNYPYCARRKGYFMKRLETRPADMDHLKRWTCRSGFDMMYPPGPIGGTETLKCPPNMWVASDKRCYWNPGFSDPVKCVAPEWEASDGYCYGEDGKKGGKVASM